MNINILSEAIGNIDEKYIKSALEYVPEKSRRPLYRAAAIIVLVLVVFTFSSDLLKGLGGPGQDDVLRPLNVIEFSGMYYEQVDMTDKKLLDKFNLPYEITPDMLGTHLGSGLGAKGEALGNFYAYRPYSGITTDDHRVCRSVYINEENGEYSFVLFCNPVSFDTNTHTEFSELLNIYGIDEDSDIAKIIVGKKTYSDKDDISRIYDILVNSLSMGGDDFEAFIDVGTDEFAQMEVYEELAESMVEISIVSVHGVVAHNIRYYPTMNCIRWALSYFELSISLNY